MRTRLCIAIACLAICAGCSDTATGPEAGLALIEEVAASMGGWPAMDAIKTQEIRTAGGDWEPLQAIEPDGDARQVNTFAQVLYVDLENRRMHLDFNAVRAYPFRSNLEYTEILDSEAGMLASPDASGQEIRERLHPSRYATRLRDFNRLPIKLLYVARNAPDLRREADEPGDETTFEVLRYSDSGVPVELYIDRFDKLPKRVVYMEDDPLYGDSTNELVLSDWKEVDGVRLPHTVETFVNGRKLREERIRSLINNPTLEADVFTIPDEIRSQEEIGERVVSQWTLRRAAMGTAWADFTRPQKVDIVQVAPGVHHVTGGSHHSMVVELSDGLMVVETPLFEERSVAVLQALEQAFPDKPVRYAVLTHFHMDHSGGIRAYAAKGATLLMPESIVPWAKEVLARGKTIRPDSLASAVGAAPPIEGVAELRSIDDPQRTVELRHVPNAHAAGMLAVYLPQERIVFVSDLYSPGLPIQPGDQQANAYAFYNAITSAKLSVNRIVGGHGGVGPFRDLERFVSGGGA